MEGRRVFEQLTVEENLIAGAHTRKDRKNIKEDIQKVYHYFLGGISVGIYQESLPNEISFILDHCDATIVVVEDQEQVDKIFEIKEEIPKASA